MSSLKNSGPTSTEKPLQLPLKGMHALISENEKGWRKHITNLGDGRFKVTAVKIKK